MRKEFTLALAAAAIASAVGAAPADAALPDLVVRSVKSAHASVRAGDELRVGFTVRNRGAARAGSSTARAYLSRDASRDRGDERLGRRRVPPLDAGAKVRRRRQVRIPTGTPAGYYRLVVCADVRRAIAELRERNNCRASRARLRVRSSPVPRGDHVPPVFAGLAAATTCIPGPIGSGIETSYHLSWSPAEDNKTPQKEIVYDVFQADTPGGQNLDKPNYTSKPGATSLSTPPLTSDKTWYFVVRARDRAGNRDTNRVEREGQNLCN
jgi:CARDB protein